MPITLKSDQEPAIKSVINNVINSRNKHTKLEHSPVGDSQSNGSIENAIRKVEGQIRLLKLQLENHDTCAWTPNKGFIYISW